MSYSVDTSALMDGWGRWYPQDIFPSVWTSIETMIVNGKIVSSEEVLRELEKKEGDSLHTWAKQHRQMFVPLSREMQSEVSRILKEFPTLVDSRTGKSFADPFVVAVAIVNGHAVVTGEKPTGSPKRPRIPDVCSRFGIRVISLVELLREQACKF